MIGSRIGNYELVREIPGGGMGRVFEAIQLTLSRTVAIKVLRQELAESDDQAARFRREADTLARLDHENIVRVYDVVEHDGAHYIVMEYVGGPPLGELLAKAGRFPPAFARDVAVEIAGALSAAHGSGIIHRDIKPGNILFTTAGRPKLADFGIARMLDTATNTQSQLVGTPYYMSPEQVRGEGLSPASDVYSLGVVLYEMLSGHVPFNAETPIGVALKHVQEAPPSLADTDRDLPAELCRLIDRALDKDARRRYASAEEFQDTLQRLSLGAPAGRALRSLFPRLLAGTGELICRGCTAELQPGFLTCPQCGRSVRGSRGAPVAAAPAAGTGAAAQEGPNVVADGRAGSGAAGLAGGVAGRPSGRRAVGAPAKFLVSALAGAVAAVRRSAALGVIADVSRRAQAPGTWPTIAVVAGIAALGGALLLLPGSTPVSDPAASGGHDARAGHAGGGR
jgi:predicted Ser/Thr protein kinase